MSRRRVAGSAPRQTPYRRTYPDGRVVWISRYQDPDGGRRYAKPRWNDGRSTFDRKADAQRAIDEALLEQRGLHSEDRQKVGDYLQSWLDRHPRSERTNKTYRDRVGYVLDVQIEGRPLREWLFDELRRRHVHDLLDHLLRSEGRAAEGARGVLRALSAMAEDAIADDAAQANPFMGVRLRGNDPRIRKPARKVRVWSFAKMREFAAAGRAGVRVRTPRPPDPRSRGRYTTRPRFYSPYDYEALLLTPALTGLRLGELLALRRSSYADGLLTFESSAHEGDLVGPASRRTTSAACPCRRASPPCSMPCLPPRGARRSSRPRAGTSGASATSTATSGAGADRQRPRPDPARVPPLLYQPPPRRRHRRRRPGAGRRPPDRDDDLGLHSPPGAEPRRDPRGHRLRPSAARRTALRGRWLHFGYKSPSNPLDLTL